jgi:hypothetical protein
VVAPVAPAEVVDELETTHDHSDLWSCGTATSNPNHGAIQRRQAEVELTTDVAQ